MISEAALTPTSVYRYYDSNGILLYVGITARGVRRQREHNGSKEWWPFVARQDVEHFDTRREAEAVEREAIQRYKPPFNKQHNAAHEGVRLAYLALVETQADTGARLQSAGRSAERHLDLYLLEQGQSDHVVLRTGLADSAIATVLAMPDAKERPRVFGATRKGGARVMSVERAGPYAALHLSSPTLRHSLKSAYATLRFAKGQKGLVLRNVHLELDHLDGPCGNACPKNKKAAS